MAFNVRAGVVGSGGIAHVHVAAWQSLRADVSVFSVDPLLSTFATRYGITAASSLGQLIDMVDVIDVCTPTTTHQDIVLAAAAAKRHVICEKPLALTHDAAAAMIAACDTAGVGLHPGQVVRFFPEYAAAKAQVDSGRIGAPAVLRLARRGAKPTAPWFTRPELSGGLFVDQMIHDFDYARWIAGDVTTVYAKLVRYGDGLATGYAVLTHASGALTHVQGGWGPPHTVFETAFTLSGTAGRLQHSSTARPALRWDAPILNQGPGGGLLPPIDEQHSPFTLELAEFAAAITSGTTPRVTASDSLAALNIALAADRSATTGQPESIEEVAA